MLLHLFINPSYNSSRSFPMISIPAPKKPLLIANKPWDPIYGYKDAPKKPLARSHSFSVIESPPHRIKSTIDTSTPLKKSKPVLSDEVRSALIKAHKNTPQDQKKNLLIYLGYTKEALPEVYTPAPITLKSSDPSLEWKAFPCKLFETERKYVALTNEIAFFISRKSENRTYNRLNNQEAITKKISPSYEQIGIPIDTISRLGTQEFYFYIHNKSRIGRLKGVTHTTRAYLNDCENSRLTTEQLVIKCATDLIHQVKALHEKKITHLDIKDPNVCKTKEDRFVLIDREDSLDFGNKKSIENKLQKEDWIGTPQLMPYPLCNDLIQAQKDVSQKGIAKAFKTAQAIDKFALSATIYYIAYYHKKNHNDIDFAYPYTLSSKQPYPSILHDLGFYRFPLEVRPRRERDQTLSMFSEAQRSLLDRCLSTKQSSNSRNSYLQVNIAEQPSLKELAEAFPLQKT